jgi:hypothetical protein
VRQAIDRAVTELVREELDRDLELRANGGADVRYEPDAHPPTRPVRP